MRTNPFQDAMAEKIKLQLLMEEEAGKKVAPIVKDHILAGIDGGMAPKDAVAHACHGALSGLLLIDKKLPKGAVAAMYGVNEVAGKMNWDNMEAMTWAMEGVARIKPAVAVGVLHDIEQAINEAFDGAGMVFRGLAAKL